MPRLQLLSDIHLEHHADGGIGFLSSLETDVDIMVLAGDICGASQLPNVLKWFGARFPQVLYVTGNHEYYGSDFATVHQRLEDIPTNVHWLQNKSIWLGGVHFCGTTLWFEDHSDLAPHKHRLNDYKMIGDFVPRVYAEHAAAVHFLSTAIRPYSVVITHHVPTSLAIPSRFRGSPLTGFFVSDMAHIPEVPRLWMFGHTHDSFDAVGPRGTRFLCNPTGYPHEKASPGYQKECVFDVVPMEGKS